MSRPGAIQRRRLDVDGLANARDLGLLRRANGSMTPAGVFYRSENVDWITWKDYWDNGLVGTALYYLPHLAAMPERAGASLSAIVGAPPGGVLFHCMGGRDRTGMIAMLLLAAVGTEPEQIVADYLETVRLGDQRSASANRNIDEPAIEAFCRSLGTSTEGAFRSALAGLDIHEVLDAAMVSRADRQALLTWRGTIPGRWLPR